MPRARRLSLLLVLAGTSLSPVSASSNCDEIGTGNHVVCAVLGTACTGKTGSCITIVIPKENTIGGDCLCSGTAAGIPNDSTFLLSPTGKEPNAAGHATIRILPDGRRAAAIGLRGLTPFASYQTYAHFGAVGGCLGGTTLPLASPIQANAQGHAIVIEEIPGKNPISVRQIGGSQQVVLCGAPPISSLPSANPLGYGGLGLVLAVVAGLTLWSRFTFAAGRIRQ